MYDLHLIIFDAQRCSHPALRPPLLCALCVKQRTTETQQYIEAYSGMQLMISGTVQHPNFSLRSLFLRALCVKSLTTV